MHGTRIAIIYGILLAPVLAGDAWARPSSLEVNVRESCRRAIAGQYLASLDGFNRAKDSITLITRKLNGIKREREKAELILDELNAQEKTVPFDIKIAEKKNRLLQTIEAYRYQEKSYETLKVSAELDRVKTKSEESSFKKEIAKVFKIVKLKQNDKTAGYPFFVDYKHTCSKYRRLCPLPFKMATELKKITIDGENPQPCTRYASFSNL